MSLKDKLEIGLKPDAPYRPDNLPEFQQNDPSCEVASTPGTSPGVEAAREDCDDGAPPRRVVAKLKTRRRAITPRTAAASRTAAAARRSAKTRAAARPQKSRSRSR
jgi:hypothetical protein